jgi:small subunit ribosomal protein S4e
MAHLKRLAMPATWPLERKKTVWITTPLPSGHPRKFCMPINLILRDILQITKSTHETKKLLANEEVLIDGRRIKDYKEAIGLFDILSIPKLKKTYTFIITCKNKLKLIEIDETSEKLEKIKVKKAIKGGKIQLTFHDGRNVIADNKYKVNDSVLFDLKQKKIKEHLPLAEGALVYVTGGKKVGSIGKFEAREGRFGLVDFGQEKKKIPIDNLFVVNQQWAKIIEENNK